MPAGSHTAISCSSLYATCSARSLRLRSKRSSRVSTRTGGGVSLGSYKKNILSTIKNISKIKGIKLILNEILMTV